MTKTKHYLPNKIKRILGRAWVTGSILFLLCVVSIGVIEDDRPIAPVGNGGILISEWTPEHD